MWTGVVLAAIGAPAVSLAVGVASSWGLVPALLLLPALWLAIGALLCVASVITSRLLQPRLSANRPIAMYSWEFACWWLVSLPPLQPFLSLHLPVMKSDWRICTVFKMQYVYVGLKVRACAGWPPCECHHQCVC